MSVAPVAVVLELMTMGQQSTVHLSDVLWAAYLASTHQELAAEILTRRRIHSSVQHAGRPLRARPICSILASAPWASISARGFELPYIAPFSSLVLLRRSTALFKASIAAARISERRAQFLQEVLDSHAEFNWGQETLDLGGDGTLILGIQPQFWVLSSTDCNRNGNQGNANLEKC